MQEETVTLDKSTFKALASETRIAILKSLDQRRKTASEIAGELMATVQGVSEHLSSLQQAGLVERRESGRKWVYYQLTSKGSAVLHPDAKKFWVLVGLSLIAFTLGGQTILSQFFLQPQQSFAIAQQAEPPSFTPEVEDTAQPTLVARASPQPTQNPPLAAAAQTEETTPIEKVQATPKPQEIESTRQTTPAATPKTQIRAAQAITSIQAKPLSQTEAAFLVAGALLLLSAGWLKLVKKTT